MTNDEMEGKRIVRDIQQRTFEFAVRIVRLVNSSPKSVAGGVFARQVMRSGTSVGANVEEAQSARSKREFVHKMTIARAEAREVLYWLRLAGESDLLSTERLGNIIQEADEIVRILTTIVKRSKAGMEQDEKTERE